MPDISLCKNEQCPSKDYCYRFTATPTPKRQSYTGFTIESDEVSCSYFMPNGKCKHCKKTNCHKMSCPTQKIQIKLQILKK